jgi:cell division protein FtsZ
MKLNELPLESQIPADRGTAIKLIGVGGAGSNAVDRLKAEDLERLKLAVINTDYQALSSSPVQEKLLIGMGVTRGLGAGGDPDLGREAAEADREKIAAVVRGSDLVFLLAGMGGGTGSGAAPIVAEAASDEGALVIAFVTLPFSFEGGRRLKQAEDGLRALRQVCDAVIPLPNDVLLQEAAENETVLDSFARADAWIGRGVKSIWAMLTKTGLINLDFATLRQVFQQRGGKTLFGLGQGTGEGAVGEAVASLKLCPLLHTPEFSRKADRLLVNIVGGPDLALPAVNELMSAIADQFGRDSSIVMGAVIDGVMQKRIEVCVMGVSDMGGRAVAPRRAAGRVRPGAPGGAPLVQVPAEAAVREGSPAGDPGPQTEGGTPADARPAAAAKAVPVAQDEFGFGELESRGHFEKTDRNLHDGQDLDVPTYLRKGIKIALV